MHLITIILQYRARYLVTLLQSKFFYFIVLIILKNLNSRIFLKNYHKIV